MRRRLLIVLLSLGTLAGFGAGAASWHCRRHHFEQHLARVCVQAAGSLPPVSPSCPPPTPPCCPPPAR